MLVYNLIINKILCVTCDPLGVPEVGEKWCKWHGIVWPV